MKRFIPMAILCVFAKLFVAADCGDCVVKPKTIHAKSNDITDVLGNQVDRDTSRLPSGIYIIKKGDKAYKIIINR